MVAEWSCGINAGTIWLSGGTAGRASQVWTVVGGAQVMVRFGFGMVSVRFGWFIFGLLGVVVVLSTSLSRLLHRSVHRPKALVFVVFGLKACTCRACGLPKASCGGGGGGRSSILDGVARSSLIGAVVKLQFVVATAGLQGQEGFQRRCSEVPRSSYSPHPRRLGQLLRTGAFLWFKVH